MDYKQFNQQFSQTMYIFFSCSGAKVAPDTRIRTLLTNRLNHGVTNTDYNIKMKINMYSV
jgi:hypothetical protein